LGNCRWFRQAIGFVGDDGDARDALGGDLLRVLRHGVAALGGLAAGHRHGIVEPAACR